MDNKIILPVSDTRLPYGLQNIGREAYYDVLSSVISKISKDKMQLDRTSYPFVSIVKKRFGKKAKVIARIESDLPIAEPDDLANEMAIDGHRREYNGLKITVVEKECLELVKSIAQVLGGIFNKEVEIEF